MDRVASLSLRLLCGVLSSDCLPVFAEATCYSVVPGGKTISSVRVCECQLKADHTLRRGSQTQNDLAFEGRGHGRLCKCR